MDLRQRARGKRTINLDTMRITARLSVDTFFPMKDTVALDVVSDRRSVRPSNHPSSPVVSPPTLPALSPIHGRRRRIISSVLFVFDDGAASSP